MLGLFTAFAGLVYALRADEEDGNVRRAPSGTGFARVIGGVDWGYTNPTAAAVFGLDGDDRAWQLDELYQRRAPLEGVVLPALVELTRRHGVRAWYGGPDEPEHLEALRRALAEARLPFHCNVLAADDRVGAGIQTVTRLLERRGDGTRGHYVDPRCVHTLAEYAAYQYPPAAGAGEHGALADPLAPGMRGLGGALSELPQKANDHLMDATRYALHTHLRAAHAARTWMDTWLARRAPEVSPQRTQRARRPEWGLGLGGRGR